MIRDRITIVGWNGVLGIESIFLGTFLNRRRLKLLVKVLARIRRRRLIRDRITCVWWNGVNWKCDLSSFK